MTAEANQTHSNTSRANGRIGSSMRANDDGEADTPANFARASAAPTTFIAIGAGSIASCWAYIFNPSSAQTPGAHDS